MKKLALLLCLVSAAPVWAVRVVSGSFASNTVTGNQTVDTGVDSVLKAIRFYGTNQTATGLADVQAGFHGMAVSSTKRKVLSWYSADAAVTTSEGTRAADLCILWLSDAGTVNGSADFVSFGTGANAGQFTINVTDAPAAAYLVYYEAYYGDALSNVNLTEHTRATGTGNESETGIGFPPQFIITMGSNHTALGHSADAVFGISACAAVGDCISVGFWADSGDGAGGYAPKSVQGSNYRMIHAHSTGGAVGYDSLLSFDVDGFTFNKIATTGANTLFWVLSFRGGRYDVGSFDSPIAGGTPQDQSVTTSFLPNGVSFLTGMVATTLNATTAASHMGFSFGYDSSGTLKEQYAWGITHDVRNPTITGMGNSNAKSVFYGTQGSPPTVNGEADYKTQTSTSFTVTWTDLTTAAARSTFIAFGSPLQECPSGPKSAGTAVGLFTTPTNVFISDNLRAVEGTLNDTMAAYDFGLSPVSGNNIDGILVESEMNATGGTVGVDQNTTDIRLSWNGGTSWTAFKSVSVISGDPEVYYAYGGAADTWGRTWTVAELNNPNFRVGIKYALEDVVAMAINIDHVRVTVYCSAPGGAGNERRRIILSGGR